MNKPSCNLFGKSIEDLVTDIKELPRHDRDDALIAAQLAIGCDICHHVARIAIALEAINERDASSDDETKREMRLFKESLERL